MRRLQYHVISCRSLYTDSLVDIAAAAEKANVDYFHLREKDLAPGELLKIAREVRAVLHNTRLMIHAALEVALASSADGVHLQSASLPISIVKERFPALRIGYSAHSLEEMRQAEKEGADFVFISPVFQPMSKQSHYKSLGTEVLRSWAGCVRIPVIGLGGITASRIAEVRDAGCSGVAGISLFVKNGKFTSSNMVA